VSKDGLIILKPIQGHEENELFEHNLMGQKYWRSWGRTKLFVNSPAFPSGIEIGVVYQHTDTGIGTPFAERGDLQIGDDARACLEAYAEGRPYLSMPERRKHAKETEQYINEKGAGIKRDSTASPTDSLKDIAADRQDARIQKMIDAAVAAALEKATGSK
jgi:hypothetical protein